mmetsp:Transcript_710/g.1699  ORF Transcript_710/g.1699 Transcript_710/m.1699 type:complete len:238 (+) Transcript_710:122-835(+)
MREGPATGGWGGKGGLLCAHAPSLPKQNTHSPRQSCVHASPPRMDSEPARRIAQPECPAVRSPGAADRGFPILQTKKTKHEQRSPVQDQDRPEEQLLRIILSFQCSMPVPLAEVPIGSALVRHGLEGDDGLFFHRPHDSDHDRLVPGIKCRPDVLREFLVIICLLRESEILAGLAGFSHQANEVIIRDVRQCILGTGHERRLAVVRRGHELLHLFPGEKINANEVALCVSVLPCLGS